MISGCEEYFSETFAFSVVSTVEKREMKVEKYLYFLVDESNNCT